MMNPDNSGIEKFNEIDVHLLEENLFKLIQKDWFLITAGNEKSMNTMTANWGGLGYLWNKNVCFIFIRPTRYTYKFVEENEFFTLSFFEEKYRKELDFCGSKSGRDVNKIEECGFTPVYFPEGSVALGEAKLVMVCRKLHTQDIDPANFVDKAIDKNYPKRDYHRMYIGEIVKAYRV
jgi:flavin reductase (DIM6/NTAB) family NADH-FMN oxidoreductase RutF